jgi:site-specific recombinase XerD
MTPVPEFAGRLEAFFTDRLLRQRRASPHTIGGYRDTFRLLLTFSQQQLKKAPSRLAIKDLDAPFIGAFLDHLEQARGNSARTRNVRLAAIHSFFRYLALQDPAHGAVIQRVLAMPSTRYDRRPIGFLTRPEMEALLAAPDRRTWAGQRDHALLLVAVQTGLRVSEAIALRMGHVTPSGLLVLQTKFRKSRLVPLHPTAVSALDSYLELRRRRSTVSDYLFISPNGGRLPHQTVAKTFLHLMRHAGLRSGPETPGPRIHDLRHYAESRIMPRTARVGLIRWAKFVWRSLKDSA